MTWLLEHPLAVLAIWTLLSFPTGILVGRRLRDDDA
jgi:hypothetical protein